MSISKNINNLQFKSGKSWRTGDTISLWETEVPGKSYVKVWSKNNVNIKNGDIRFFRDKNNDIIKAIYSQQTRRFHRI